MPEKIFSAVYYFSTQSDIDTIRRDSYWLRHYALSVYLNCPEDDLIFGQTKTGKPILLSHSNIHFNISHTIHWIVIAISTLGVVGIDIENTSRLLPSQALKIAKRFFHPSEYQWLKCCPENMQPKSFIRLWTLKEASLKMTGEGIAKGGLDSWIFDDSFCLKNDHKVFYYQATLPFDTVLSLAKMDNFKPKMIKVPKYPL